MEGKGERISPEDALDRAFWMVKAPSLAMLVTPTLVYVLLSHYKYLPSIGPAGLKWAAPFFLLSFVGGWLVWSIQVPRWRLWAYRRVKNIGLLKDMAVQSQLVWSDTNIFTKTEIMSKEVRAELARLEGESKTGSH
ncbi:MAG TPA: hypothetical protein VNH80_15475 [Burkholderiales bacterium]|nr:hypothetical protein [Burkholderiales bacterium]